MSRSKPNKIKEILKAFLIGLVNQINKLISRLDSSTDKLASYQQHTSESSVLEIRERGVETEEQSLEARERNVEIEERESKIALQRAKKAYKTIALVSYIVFLITLFFYYYLD